MDPSVLALCPPPADAKADGDRHHCDTERYRDQRPETRPEPEPDGTELQIGFGNDQDQVWGSCIALCGEHELNRLRTRHPRASSSFWWWN